MSTIINMQEYLANKQLKEQLIPFFYRLNPSFQHFHEPFEAAFILRHDMNVVVFTKFIPNNTYTELPTISDSYNDIRSNPRTSTGEWVVENIFELPVGKAFDIAEELKSQVNEPVQFLKRTMQYT